jgi:predicted metal-dependent hydrolase
MNTEEKQKARFEQHLALKRYSEKCFKEAGYVSRQLRKQLAKRKTDYDLLMNGFRYKLSDMMLEMMLCLGKSIKIVEISTNHDQEIVNYGHEANRVTANLSAMLEQEYTNLAKGWKNNLRENVSALCMKIMETIEHNHNIMLKFKL